MLDEKLLAELNGRYVCPPDAGPAWREACEYGFDMSLVEAALRKTPEERLEEHQHALNLVLEILTARQVASADGPERSGEPGFVVSMPRG